MTTEQQLTAALPLTASTSFADSLYTSALLQSYVTTSTNLEQRSADALATGDTITAFQLAECIMSLNEEVFSFSFEA
jgi:hypothetical protein